MNEGEKHVCSLKTWRHRARTPSEEMFILLQLSSGHWMASSNCYFMWNRWLAVVTAAVGLFWVRLLLFSRFGWAQTPGFSWHAKPPYLIHNPPFCSLWLVAEFYPTAVKEQNSFLMIRAVTLRRRKMWLSEKRDAINNSTALPPRYHIKVTFWLAGVAQFP